MRVTLASGLGVLFLLVRFSPVQLTWAHGQIIEDVEYRGEIRMHRKGGTSEIHSQQDH